MSEAPYGQPEDFDSDGYDNDIPGNDNLRDDASSLDSPLDALREFFGGAQPDETGPVMPTDEDVQNEAVTVPGDTLDTTVESLAAGTSESDLPTADLPTIDPP